MATTIDDVEDIAPRVQYVAFNGQTAFDYPFPIFDDGDLVVLVNSTLNALSTNYTVTGSGNSNGGTVTFLVGCTAGDIVTIYRDIPIERSSDFQQNGPFSSAALNTELDRITLVEQQLESAIKRCLRIPVTVPVVDSALEFSPTLWANKYVTLDGNGIPTPAAIVTGTITKATVTSLLGGNPNRDRTAAEIAASVVPVNFGYDTEYIERQGALAGNSVDALAAVNKAIQVNARRINSYDGDFKVTAAPTNPYGVEFRGSGSLLLPTAYTFPKQLNSYADLHKYFIGREYLARVDLRLSVSALGATNIGCFLYGDSTIANSGVTDPTLYAETLLPRLANHKGLTCALNVTNRGVAGTNVSSLNAIPDLSTTTDFIIVKYGINDGLISAGTRLSTFATTLRSKLAAIRAATNGDLPHLAILLMGPNATASDTDGRNEQWYEQLRGIYVQAARDYNCAYFDTYAFFKDARPAASLWMDANTIGGQTNVPIHPNNLMQVWMWGAVMDFVFPTTWMDPYRGNHIQNIPQLVKTYTFASLSTAYDYGVTVSRALVSDGWPVDGTVVTIRHVNSPTLQFLTPTTATVQLYQRVGNNVAWSIWYSEDTITPALNVSWVAYSTGSDLKAIKGGKVVTLNGLIKNGTTTNGTTLTQLPAGFRPRTTQIFLCPTSSSTLFAKISIDTSGNVVGVTGLDATQTSLSGISFEAVA